MLEIVDELRSNGEITLGSYPYASGGGGLRVSAWAEEGGPEETRKRLADPIQRRRIVEEVVNFWTWDAAFHGAHERRQPLDGRTSPSTARGRGGGQRG